MYVGLVVYGGLDERSGGFRYDRKLREHLEAAGDTVEVIALPWRSYERGLVDGLSPTVRSRLDRPYDVLLQDGLCHPSLWHHNAALERPRAIVSIVHLLRSTPSRGSPWRRPLERAVERRYLRTVDGVVCPSRDIERRVGALTAGVGTDADASAEPPTVVAPPAGRTEDAATDPEAVVRRTRSEPFRLLFLGNLVPRKGLHTLVDALETVGHRDWELTVVGGHDADPAYARRTRRRLAALDSIRVSVEGAVDDRTLETHLERAHVLAVPSRYESFGMVYLEAMERGVVPVATAAGGAASFVIDRENGLLVRPGDPRQLAAALTWLATDRDRLAEMGRAALETACAHPSWETSMERIRTFLHERLEATAAERLAVAEDTR